MNIVGNMLVKNEEWILRFSIPVAMLWVDKLLIGDDASTDGTMAIITEMMDKYPDRIRLIKFDRQPFWNEMDLRDVLLKTSGEMGATHVALIDADEAITANLSINTMRGMVEALGPRSQLLLPMVPVWKTPQCFRNDKSIWSHSVVTVAFPYTKDLTYKPSADGYQYHHRVPYGPSLVKTHPKLNKIVQGGLMHLQWVNWARIVAKHAWYKMMERARYPNRATSMSESLNAKYGRALDEHGMQLYIMPPSWITGVGYDVSKIDQTDIGWYREECRKLLEEKGAAFFRGLDLFGVVKL